MNRGTMKMCDKGFIPTGWKMKKPGKILLSILLTMLITLAASESRFEKNVDDVEKVYKSKSLYKVSFIDTNLETECFKMSGKSDLKVSTMVNGRMFVKISRKVYSTAAYSMAEYSTACITAKYSTAEYSTVEYSTAMYSTRFKIIDTGLVTDRRNEAIRPLALSTGSTL